MRPSARSLRFLVGAGLLLAPVASVARQTPQIREKTHLEEVEQLLFDHVNAERVREGLNPLLREPILVEIARSHTLDMLEREFFDHENPDGQGPAARVGRLHRTLVGEVSENVWTEIRSEAIDPAAMAKNIMEGLMNSPGHRRNILTPALTHLGLGVYSSSGLAVMTTEFMVTQLFGAVRSYLEEPLPESLLLNQVVRFRLRDLASDRTDAEYYDLWSPEEQRPVIGPTPIGRSRLEVSAGTFQLRFLYPSAQQGQLDAVSAPYVTVR